MYLKKENAVAAGKKIKPKSQTWNFFIYFFYLKKKACGRLEKRWERHGWWYASLWDKRTLVNRPPSLLKGKKTLKNWLEPPPLDCRDRFPHQKPSKKKKERQSLTQNYRLARMDVFSARDYCYFFLPFFLLLFGNCYCLETVGILPEKLEGICRGCRRSDPLLEHETKKSRKNSENWLLEMGETAGASFKCCKYTD